MSVAAAVAVVDCLSVDYGQRRVLDGVSFSARAGELIAVVGPNGAGKSTLFRAIAGLVQHGGTVTLAPPPDLPDRAPAAPARRAGRTDPARRAGPVAYVPQQSELDLDFPITVSQLVAAARRPFLRLGQRLGAEHRAAVATALARVGLSAQAGRPLRALSGGQVQRALIARALAQEAPLVLLDEALAGVDPPTVDGLVDLFCELCHDGTTMLVATHDLALTRQRFCRCLAVNGRLVADGDPATVLTAPSIARTFGALNGTG